MNESEAECSAVTNDAVTLSTLVELPRGAHPAEHRKFRQQRITWAWGTSLLSKFATIGIQLLAVPLVYNVLGESGYASYAAVTASASLISILNLGIGGSLVTPIAEAAAEEDKHRQALLVQAGLSPLLLMCVAGSIIAIPLIVWMPLNTLFGKAGAAGSNDLRLAAVIAAGATLASIPLSSSSFLRQAYQEMHITNLIGTVSNISLLFLLLIAARLSHSLALFVGLFVLVPLAALALNMALLFLKRQFLLRRGSGQIWADGRLLLGDGLRFLGASLSNALVFQWPVYWIARTLPTSTSSWFAICIQFTLLPYGFFVGLLQPLWSSTADALARRDHAWVVRQTRKVRTAVVLIGVTGISISLLFGQSLVQLWLRKPLVLPAGIRCLMGVYFALALWEQFHFYMALGNGKLREAASAQFHRALAFAIAVPFLTMLGGVSALWIGMCASILLWSGWQLPRLIHHGELKTS